MQSFLNSKNFSKTKEFFPGIHYINGMEQSFWQRVKLQLKAHRFTQKELAEYIDVPVQTIWNWIYYDRLPDAFTACCIAEAMGVTVEYLVRGSDDDNLDDKLQRTMDRKTAAKKIQILAKRINEETGRLNL